MDRLPPFDELEAFRSELEQDFQLPPEERKRRKKDRIDEILEMLIMAYMFGNEAANTMLYGSDVVDQTEPEQEGPNRVIDIDTDDMNRAVFKIIAGKNWEQRISEYYDSDSGTIDDIIRVVDTDMNRVYNDSILNVGERAEESEPEQGMPTVGVTKTWETMMDERVRSTHEPLQSVSVPVNGRFHTWDGDSARYPGDFTDPNNNINCRCRIVLSN